MLAGLPKIFSKPVSAAALRRLRPTTRRFQAYLQRHRDRFVGRDELMDAVWPGRVVSDQSLYQCVAEIRAVFGAESVETQPGHGYRWRATSRGRQRTVLAATGALAVLLAAAMHLATSRVVEEAAPAPVIAVVPLPPDHLGFERRLAEWISGRLPARLVTGPQAMSAAVGPADLLVDVRPLAGEGYAYEISGAGRGTVLAGDLNGADPDALAGELGGIVRQAFLAAQGRTDAPAEFSHAAHQAALTHLMAGEVERARGVIEALLTAEPTFLPARELAVQLELGERRTPAARRHAEDIRTVAERQGAGPWRLAAQLALTDVLLAEGSPGRARSLALDALSAAEAVGSRRRSGKAAERLAEIDRPRGDRAALDWLLRAHRHYDAAGCTVGTARVEDRIRRLRNPG